MPCRYPIVLVHGLALKDFRRLRAFGRIEQILREAGNEVYTANVDGFGTVENNAAQLKRCVEQVLLAHGAEKVNLIAHSKGGLDSKYMIVSLGMADKVASLTTLCTPHRGSHAADLMLRLPDTLKKPLANGINYAYRTYLGDQNPDAMEACRQLQAEITPDELLTVGNGVYCQSYWAHLKRGSDCFLMGLPMQIYRFLEGLDSDGLVSQESAKFGNYRGEAIDSSLSHVQVVDLLSTPTQKKKLYRFYTELAQELARMGF